MGFLKKFKMSEKGQTYTEYAIILVVLALIIIAAIGPVLAWAWNLVVVPIVPIAWWQASLVFLAFLLILSVVCGAVLAGVYRLLRKQYSNR